ncbi:hypothetical protein JZ751_024666 [Albula glossodonta]|uniref:WD repeat-containing protein 18 C-terminal domain-containing protein n=1 Tax=Albula glossodonta TaxID=121402 RepID=A0A8T2PMD1_9TELE|nr:hypothetical protein JZ751_024666 [Albula glossodonta]
MRCVITRSSRHKRLYREASRDTHVPSLGSLYGISKTTRLIHLCSLHQGSEETYLEKAEKLYSLMCAVTDKSVFGDGENTKVRVAELEEEVKTLKKINKDLYDFSTQLLTKPS